MCTDRRRSRGFTLVEVILTIVIVAIALASVMSVFVVTTRHSADPMVTQQAQFIAEAYLEEILRQKFFDPDTDIVCTGTTTGESRATYDNVCDYELLADNPPKNAFGGSLTDLSAYSVAVTVSNSGLTLNNINNTGAVRVLRVDVTVTGPNSTSITLSGYRTNYNCGVSGDPGCKGL
jgi:MSHA pilin protein MshD